MIKREEALALVKENVDNENLIKHMIAVEAVMRALAAKFGEDEDLWGITGLLHDLDYSSTVNDFEKHGHLTCEMLKDRLPDEALHAILAHPAHVPAETKFDWALYCSDPVTGLITAAALMHPSHSLKELPLKSVKKRFKDRRFAAGADRDQIRTCEKLDIELGDFLDLSLSAMAGISEDLGL